MEVYTNEKVLKKILLLIINMDNRVIIALDNLDERDIYEIVGELGDNIIFKINSAFTRYGPQLIENIQREVFLDLKFHDIPNTVSNHMRAVADLGVCMCTIHCLGGYKMMKVAVDSLRQYCRTKSLRQPLLIGVTILTSMNNETLRDDLKIDTEDSLAMTVHLAKLAKKAGLDGVVCSPLEIGVVKEACGGDFLAVTPGIRPEWAVADDQARFTTPRMAIELGSDYLVIGRPIIQAEKYDMTRREAFEMINQQL